MNLNKLSIQFFVVCCTFLLFSSCDNKTDEENKANPEEVGEANFQTLQVNSLNNIILPTIDNYLNATKALETAGNTFASNINDANLNELISKYQVAFENYQLAAVHNYFGNATFNLIQRSNLYPIDVTLLEGFIANKSYNFGSSTQERANGYPALDYLLFSQKDNTTAFFNEDPKRVDFLKNLVTAIKDRAQLIHSDWNTEKFKTAFKESTGTNVGSVIATQLNQSIYYVEKQIRENKVGIPVGRTNPNNTPFAADPTKIEAYYQSIKEGNETFSLKLVKLGVQEFERIYLGTGHDNKNGIGYDDLIIARGKPEVDEEIKNKIKAIYNEIDNRTAINGDEKLWEKVRDLVIVFKSDLFPLLNVEDADRLNDGD